MTKRTFVYFISLGALAIAIVLGSVAYRSVSAATPTPEASTTAEATPVAPADNVNSHPGRGDGMRGGYGYGYSNEDLATALGISVDDLNAAYQKAYETALAQAVEQGLITQAQADELKANGSAEPFGGRWSGWLEKSGIDFETLLANALGITVDQLQAAYTQAFNARVDQAVADGKLTQEQADLMKGQRALFSNQDFQSSMQSAFETAVNQAVTNGVITQAQADQILKNNTNFGMPGFGGHDGFPGGKGFGGPDKGGIHGFNRHDSSNDNTVPDDTTTP